jgi:N-glycosylase/DNA lyase
LPLLVSGRSTGYRFARKKANYLSVAMKRLSEESPPISSGRELRDWLTELPGIGLKTASWVARNWLDADDVAILDIHVLRAGALGGFLDPTMSVQRDYLDLEAQFIRFSRAIGVRPSELDAVIWFEMMSSPATVTRLQRGRRGADPVERSSSRSRAQESRADTHQARLIE